MKKGLFELTVRRKRLSLRLRDEMLGWKHSGFSVDGSVKVAVVDYGRLRPLVRYLSVPIRWSSSRPLFVSQWPR